MNQKNPEKTVKSGRSKGKSLLAAVLSSAFIFSLAVMALILPGWPLQAACNALPTDRGTITATINIPSNGTYRIWSRIKTADSSKTSFLMQMDDTYCDINAGGSNIASNTWTWVDYSGGNSSQKISMNLTSGNHTLKLAGNADNVIIDKIIFTQDAACVPSGDGENCVSPADSTPPEPAYLSADINQSGFVDAADLSVLATNYGRSGDAIITKRADINTDGTVGPADLSIIATQYGQRSP